MWPDYTMGEAMQGLAVVQDFTRFWSAQDVDLSVGLLAEDAVWDLRVSQTALSFAGETVGRENIRAGFFAILAQWDYIVFEPTILGFEDGIGRIQVKFHYRHRASGNDLAGSFRANLAVSEDEITRIDEFHDAPMVEAFMKIAAQPISSE
jgi:ketosteroid isomerase-like protein